MSLGYWIPLVLLVLIFLFKYFKFSKFCICKYKFYLLMDATVKVNWLQAEISDR